MPKVNSNSRITHPFASGRVIELDIRMDQGVTKDSSPTFGSLYLNGDAHVTGNLYVLGNTTVIDTNVLELQDNLVVINSRELGPGVTLHESGFEVYRGPSKTPYRIAYNESSGTLQIGYLDQTQAVATREFVPLPRGAAVWNASEQRFDSQSHIDIDFTFSSTSNSTSPTSGSVHLAGGAGVDKNLSVGGTLSLFNENAHSDIRTDTAGALVMSTQNDIGLTCSNKVEVPAHVKLAFGSTTQSVSSDANDLLITSKRHVLFNAKKLYIPNQSDLVFATDRERIYTNGDNFLVLECANEILLDPGTHVRLRTDTPLAFGTTSQTIKATSNNDLVMNSGNDILLTPNENRYVRIPAYNGLKLGPVTNLHGDNLGMLFVEAEDKVLFLSPVTFGNTANAVSTDGQHTMRFVAKELIAFDSNVECHVTENSTNASTGSLRVRGGLGVQKDVFVERGVIVHSTSANALVVGNSLAEPLLRVDASNLGNSVVFSTDDATSATKLLTLIGGTFDASTEYTIGRGTVGSNSMSFRVPASVNDAAFSFESGSACMLRVTDQHTRVINTLIVSNTEEASSSSNASVIVQGGVAMQANVRVSGRSDFHSDVYLNARQIKDVGEPSAPSDAATKGYVDVVKQGLFVKDSVLAASVANVNVAVAVATLDGAQLASGDRILLKHQNDASENGVYVLDGDRIPIRPVDVAVGSSASGIFVFVKEGDINGALGFICTAAPGNDAVGTDPLPFTEFTGLGRVTAGDGLSKTLNEIRANVDNQTLEIASDALRIAASGLGTGLTGGSGLILQTTADQSHVTKVGTLVNGTWTADTVGVPHGGTGRELFTSGAMLYGNGTSGVLTSSNLHWNEANKTLFVTPSSGSAAAVSFAENARAKVAFDDATDLLSVRNVSSSIVLTTSGNIGINTSSPATELHVRGTTTTIKAVAASTDNAYDVSSGALVVYGGASVTKDAFIGGGVLFDGCALFSDDKALAVSTESLTIINNGSAHFEARDTHGTLVPLEFALGALVVHSSGAVLTNDGTLQIGSSLGQDGGFKVQYEDDALHIDTAGTSGTLDVGSRALTDVAITGSNSRLLWTASENALDVGGANCTVRLSAPDSYNELCVTALRTSGTLHFGRGGDFQLAAVLSNVDGSAHVAFSPDATGGTLESSLAVHTLLQGPTSMTHSVAIGAANRTFFSVNNTSGSLAWFYIGIVNNSDILISNGLANTRVMSTATDASYSVIGDRSSMPGAVVYGDTSGNMHMYLQMHAAETVSVTVERAAQLIREAAFEGTSALPDGARSGFLETWTSEMSTYDAYGPRNTDALFGNLSATGDRVTVSDNLAVFGDRVRNTSSPHTGIVLSRNQIENDEGAGDIVEKDAPTVSGTLPSQSTATMSQIVLGQEASVDQDAYVGHWIRLASGQVRKIVSYAAAVRVAAVATPWTIRPQVSEAYYVYDKASVALAHDELFDTVKLQYGTKRATTTGNVFVPSSFANLQVHQLSAHSQDISGTGGVTSYNAGSSRVDEDLFVHGTFRVGQAQYVAETAAEIGATRHTLRNDGVSKLEFLHATTGCILQSDQHGLSFSVREKRPLAIDYSTTFVGINCTSGLSSCLTIARNNFIGADGDDGFLGVGVGETNGASAKFYGSSHPTLPGHVTLQFNDLSAFSQAGLAIDVRADGSVEVFNTSGSTCSSTGSVVLHGGLAIDTLANAFSATEGGALTVAGGAGFAGNVFVKGNLVVSGTLTNNDSVKTNAALTFSDLVNCTSVAADNVKTLNISGEIMMTCVLAVSPTEAGRNTRFSFVVPERLNNFASRASLVACVSGYTDDEVAVFNVLGIPEVGTKKCAVTFQSASSDPHYFQLLLRYDNE